MKPYSADLRERVAATFAAGDHPLSQVAARFGVPLSFFNKLRQRTRGMVAALPHHGDPAPLLDEAARADFAACVARQPDATLDELRALLTTSGGPVAGRTTVWQA